MLNAIWPLDSLLSTQSRARRLSAKLGDGLKVLAVVIYLCTVATYGAMSASAFAANSEIQALTQQGISTSRAEQALALQGRVAETKLIDKLVTALGDSYAGVWFEPAAAKFHVGVISNASRRVVQLVAAEAGLNADVVETPVRSTWSALLDTQTRWNRKLARLLAHAQAKTGIHVQRNAVEVTLSSSVPESERATLMREAVSESVNVIVAVEPPSRLRFKYWAACKGGAFRAREALCEPTIVSGVNLWVAGVLQCTAGPMLIEGNETYVLTAAHCFGLREGTREAIRSVVSSEYPRVAGIKEIGSEVTRWFNREHEVAEVKIAAGSRFEQGLPTPVPALMAEWGSRTPETPHAVEGVERVAAGQATCHEGMASGEPACGTIGRLNMRFEVQEHLVETNVCGTRGDSGGPYFFRVPRTNEIRMTGTLVGGEPQCTEAGPYTSYFEPLEEIPGVRGTGSLVLFGRQSVLTRANETRRPCG